ncbi:alpha/beta fold hydrolase [Propionicicella superfundia]|uniref:alpha/beta fold hydrolase n=1 Tax=Propionicicella superfundia TaxID=348582 RepID=UPI00048EBA0A|nr:alpha/beta hydrolase [Propionicicella superfundia]
MSVFTTNDGVEVYYDVRGEGKPLLMIPGWTCTTEFWSKNVDSLAASCSVIRMDFRGHGRSEKVSHGHRISRYAADVRDLLDHLDVDGVTALGWSMGASILWSYLELYGTERLAGLVCVDQSPAQYTGPDWVWGQNGCYDVEMFIRLCAQITYDPRGSAEGLAYACLHNPPTPEDVAFIADEISLCPPQTRIDIMRDHTNLDWRDFLPVIDLPTLVLVARHSQVFDWQGSAYVGEQVPGAKTEFFENSGHMLFWEEPEKFNRVVSDFVNR